MIQESLWRRARALPSDVAFLSSAVLRLDGPLDVNLVERALRIAFAARPELSCRLVERVDGAVLVPGRDDGALVEVIDLSDRPRAEQLLEAQHLADDLARTPIDPRTDGVARARLVSLADDSHRLVVAVHPVVADGASLAMAFDDFVQTYGALWRSGSAPEVGVAIDGDAVRRRRAVALDAREDVAAFWARVLPDDLEPLSLPRGRPVGDRPAPHGRSGEYTPCLIPPRLAREAREVAEGLNTSVFVVMLAALGLLVHRYGGHRLVPVTVPIDTRAPGEIHEFGAFTTALPVVVELDEDAPFADLVAALRDRYEQTRQHSVYPLGLLAEMTEARSGVVRPQVGARYYRHLRLEAQFGDVRIAFDPQRTTRADVDLQLEIFDHGDSLVVGFIQAAGTFDSATMARIAGHYRTVLASSLQNPHRRVGDVHVLTAAEERQIRFLWNRTAMPFPDDVTVHRLIEDAVADYPGAVAVSFRGRTLSYAEFNTAANRVAHRLRALGAGPGTRICVLLERSMEMPIALVGILKSGAAYVPIEPDLPPERIRYTIVDATAPVLVTVTGLIPDGIPDGVAVLCLDGDAEAIEAESAENPPASARPDDIAYVLYTSGSTGTPKAAQIRHVGVVNLIRWITDEYALGADDRILLKTPYSHDISVPEFFLPLTMSGTLVIAPPDAHRDPDELVDLITRNGVTVVHFVPTMLREFVGTPAVRNCGSLRHVFVGGEALTRDLIEKFSQTIDAQLHNVYGPTEATDYSTAWEVQPDSEPIAPIGRPIANMRTYVVDSAGRLVPVGVAGELCVAGVGVGAGYLNRPDLTAERFVDNPFEDGEGRLYRTGDICMWRADGTLEFVGRDDGQVKIRGHRVELGEVEAALLKQPAIAEAGVLMREDQPDVRRLVAYLVTVDGVGLPSVSGLRAWCETLVPEYAVPSVFIALPALPRTGSGKLDRRALPAPGAERPDLASEYVPPRTPTERSLAAIWGEVLGLRDVGVRDSFFELGGDSILAIRIVAAAKRAGLSSSVRQMFALDTIEAQASLGGQRPADQATTTAGPALSPLGWLDNNAMTALRSAHPDLGDAYPLTPMQQGMLFHSLRRPGSGDYVEQVLSVVDGIDPDAVQRAWVDVLIRHDALRTSVALTLGEPLAIVHTHIEPDVVHLDWTGLDPGQCRRELEALLDRDRAKDFDVLNPPLWRLFLAREDGGRVRCLWSHHHLLLDGWSVARLLGDVSAALPGDTGAEGAPALPLREHAAWLLKQDSAAALAFWSTELDGVTGGTGIGLPPPASASRGRGRVIRRIDRAAIDQFCRAQRVTTATMLQGAVALLLSRYTPTTDTVFGTVVSGRAIDLEGVDSAVGCLLNTIAVRIDACGELPVGDWLRGIQDRHAAALGHSHVALADVQRELGLAPDDDLIKLLLVFEEFHLGDGEQALREIETLEAAPIPVIAAFAASGDALELRLSYDRALYAEDAMRRVARHLHALLDGLSADADTALAEVPMLGEEERRLVTQTFNDTAMPLRPEPVHDLISAIDERRVALRFNGETTTFGALNGDANRLAHALRARGAGRDVAVAICMQRSPELVTAQLAVLRAGAAYLPLDPEYPVRRIETVLHDAQAPIVIVDAAGRARIAELADLENVVVVDVESDAAQIATLPDDDPETGVTLDDLAYILYTSGSTGEPKGVAQTHRTIVNMLAWIVREYGLGPDDRWLFKTPQTFDVSVPDVFFPLAFAGQMVIAPPGAHADPGALVDLITGERVSVVQFVPSMLDAFLDHPGSARCVSLRYVMAAGEQLRRPVVDRCLAALPGAELHNLYGPTETFYVTDSRCSAGSQDPPIGRPFANTRGYVLDRRGDPVPVGATGELWIAGAGVARGYLGRAELTAQRFVRDSFSGGQMYRTGDYARWRDDGELEYLGRIDDQVKFHGQRIELGEIEAAMRAHPGVERAAVAVSEGAGGQQRLVGYIVSGPGAAVDHAAVAATVAELVPRALVPTLWMTVDHLPVTTHGKLDRSALPAPPIRGAASDPVAPRTPLERQLSQLWAEVLGGHSPWIHDDVFATGADSISTVRLVGRAQSAGIEIDVKTVFAHPTIAALAAVVERGSAAGTAASGTGGTARNWAAETTLRWPPAPAGRISPGNGTGRPLPVRPGRGVLLTGATGFVGAHLLAALVEAGQHDVYALVRAADADGARERLVATLTEQRLLDRVDLDRVIALPGDLEEREFGFGTETFARLAQRLVAIVHNGARVHHFLGYSHLRAANVDGTREAIRLAAHAGRAPLLFVSTIATSLGLDPDGWRLHDDANTPVLAGGYTESKWAAERLVLAARRHGLDARTIRLPRVMADSTSGASSRVDAALLLLKGCIQLGVCPQWTGWEAWAPVDRVARAVAAATFTAEGAPIGYVAATPVRFADLFAQLRSMGWPLTPVPVEEFRTLVESAGVDNAAALALADYGLEAGGDPRLGTASLLSDLEPVLGEPAPERLSADYLARMFDHLVAADFLPAPTGKRPE